MVIDTSALVAILFDEPAYALSKTSGEPLLFKGNDLNQTDVKRV